MNAGRILKVLFAALLLVSCGPRDGEYRFDIFSTNDVHGRYFDSTYVDSSTRLSLANVSSFISSQRRLYGDEGVILIDAGDILQGDNAAYYYNYEDTLSRHLYARISEYMRYDAAVVGNHDIETGHAVYDRIVRQLSMPFLASNALGQDSSAYFDEYVILRRKGLKIAVIGFTNPNIANWLPKELWEGLSFKAILPYAQQLVDKVIEKENPHIVVVAMHSGTGNSDASSVENEALAALNTLKGVDFVFCAHDHRSTVIPRFTQGDSVVSVLLNGGSYCREVAHATVTLKLKDGKVVSKYLKGELVPMKGIAPDGEYLMRFHQDYLAVKDFTLRRVGDLADTLRTRDAYAGRSFYTDLIHAVQLSCSPAQISFAAPLTYDGTILPGELNFQDMFTIYPFENQLFIVRMSGREIKRALEFSYASWVNSISESQLRRLAHMDVPGVHALKIRAKSDKRTSSEGYSFVNRPYNFDSAAGINYTVDLTAPAGDMVRIESLADGGAFCEDSTYNVAMTSYRASGGGGIMKAAGVDTDRIEERVIARYPQIRDILYAYTVSNVVLSKELVGKGIGTWMFVPDCAEDAINRDLGKLFR